MHSSLFICKRISPGFWRLFCIAAHFSLVMYGLSLSKISYADFPDTFIYVHSLIENLIFKVIILIDVCHFDQAVAHRCFVKTILQVSLSSCLSLLTLYGWFARKLSGGTSQIQGFYCVFATKKQLYFRYQWQ